MEQVTGIIPTNPDVTGKPKFQQPPATTQQKQEPQSREEVMDNFNDFLNQSFASELFTVSLPELSKGMEMRVQTELKRREEEKEEITEKARDEVFDKAVREEVKEHMRPEEEIVERTTEMVEEMKEKTKTMSNLIRVIRRIKKGKEGKGKLVGFIANLLKGVLKSRK